MSRFSTLKPEISKTAWLARSVLFLVLALVLPWGLSTIHPGADRIFLTMHIPVLLAGFLVGPMSGLIVGLAVPVVGLIVPGLPLPYSVSSLMLELSLYGLIAGLTYNRLHLNVYVALVATILVGRLMFVLGLLLASLLFPLSYTAADFFLIEGPLVSGLPGIFVQIFLVPIIVAAVRRRRT